MNLRKLIELADEGYADKPDPKYPDYKPDPLWADVSLLNHVDAEGYEIPGQLVCDDTLALFVVRELKDTFDPNATNEEQLKEAIRVIELAAEQLDLASSYLERALAKTQEETN